MAESGLQSPITHLPSPPEQIVSDSRTGPLPRLSAAH